ncbi:MAG: hypothetical protein QM831_28010 [Kofleriaceae bacterium]
MRWIWLLLAGCDPVFLVHADVHDRAGTPVEHARVSFVCPERHLHRDLWTDARGRAELGKIGVFGDECKIVVRRGDEPAVEYGVMEHCIDKRLFGGCATAELHAVLDDQR